MTHRHNAITDTWKYRVLPGMVPYIHLFFSVSLRSQTCAPPDTKFWRRHCKHATASRRFKSGESRPFIAAEISQIYRWGIIIWATLYSRANKDWLTDWMHCRRIRELNENNTKKFIEERKRQAIVQSRQIEEIRKTHQQQLAKLTKDLDWVCNLKLLRTKHSETANSR